MAGEGFLQRFYNDNVFVRGDDEDFCAWRSYEVVEKTVAKLVEWLYQSTTGLYPEGAQPMGSHQQELHLQSRDSASDFDFLIPLRFHPELRLRGRRTVWDPSAIDRRLPTYIYGAQGVSLFRCGSRLVVDLDTLRADGATAYCDEPAPHTGNPKAGERDRFKESIDSHHLDPVRILQDFHRYVQNALTADENSHPRDNDPVFQARMIKPRVPQIHKSIKERITLKPWDPKCPAVQLIFRLGEEELVSVDLVPAVQNKVVLSEDWQIYDLARLSDWWDKEPSNSQERFRQKGERVGRIGADIVAKDGFWRFSFAMPRQLFSGDIDSDGGQRRKALRLLKFINKECWVPEYGKILTSYHLKTVLLWAQDIHPETEKWEDPGVIPEDPSEPPMSTA
ncbi:protein mab-21-like 3 [Dermochelys coriacea]|uniref:protein mab-21-like 3 n=1 Tax=Dermochelys coriacea TaxID=27794 RepID=UPI0018E89605|nr:protein mab-21-like 3 [Dermochelys coriacea]XP_038260659.1 protein mab-21-like 3 [Dermochelys coriacea]